MTIWCGFWFVVYVLWCGLLSFSSRAFLFGFDLRPFWWVPSLLRTILVTLRHIYFLQCTSFGGVDLFDPEARICFLQCSSFSGVDFIDPEAPVYFLQWITLWHLDSGLVGYGLLMIHWKIFGWSQKVCHSPDEKFPASKVRWGWIKCLPGWAGAWGKGPRLELTFQVGQNDHHLASESLYLPWFGWKSRFCFPLRMACLLPPSSSDVGSSKGGQTITLGRKPVYSSKDFAQKKNFFFEIKDMFAIAGGFWTKSDSKVSAAVSRLVLEACPSMVRWLGDHSGSTQAGTRMIRN